MNLPIFKTNWGNEFPDKAEFWSNKGLTQEEYQVFLPSGSLAMCEMGNKVHQLRCPRIQAEQCRMDNPHLAQMGSEQSGTSHIHLQLHHSCSLHFQQALAAAAVLGSCYSLCSQFWVFLAVSNVPSLCVQCWGGSWPGQHHLSPVTQVTARPLLPLHGASPLQGLEPAKAFFTSALIALNPESLKSLYKQMWFLLFT